MSLYKTLVFGSNFGYNSHFKLLKKNKLVDNCYIYSPNIKKKKISKKNIIENIDSLKNKDFNCFSIATSPDEQKKICIFGLKNKIKYFFLEKPVTEDFRSTKQILKKFNFNKIRYVINFIYPNTNAFNLLKKKIQNKKIKKIVYKWSFQQAYFKNHQNTWKIDPKKGGGAVNFYLIHVIYNILFLLGDFKITSVGFYKRKIIEKVRVEFSIKKNIRGFIYLDINNKKNVHSCSVQTSKNEYKIINTSKDWVKNFKFFINQDIKVKLAKDLDRNILTSINFDKLFLNKVSSQEKKNYLIAHAYCNYINNKFKKNNYKCITTKL